MKKCYIKTVSHENEWQELVEKSCNANVFNMYEWGEYKKEKWKVERLIIKNNDVSLAGVQVLFKNYYGIIIGWAPAGLLVIDYKHIKITLQLIKQYLSEKYKFYYLRFNFNDENQSSLSYMLNESNELKKSTSLLNSDYTILFELDKGSDLEKNMSSNNRYYFKKANKENLFFKEETKVNLPEFISMHKSMTEEKNIKEINLDEKDIFNLCEVLGEKIKMYSVYKNNVCVSSCLLLLNNKHSFYYLAAATEEGRRVYASFFMIVNLIRDLKNKKIIHFDFGGISPYKSKASGVNRFKLGFGGQVLNKAGEWEMSNSIFISKIFNFLIKAKTIR